MPLFSPQSFATRHYARVTKLDTLVRPIPFLSCTSPRFPSHMGVRPGSLVRIGHCTPSEASPFRLDSPRVCALSNTRNPNPLFALLRRPLATSGVAGPSPNNLYPHFVTAGTLRTKALHISRGMPVAPTGDRWQEFVARSGYSLSTTHFLTQTNPAAPSKSGPTAAGTGTTPLAESPPANASASPFRAESCAARRPLPPAFAPGTNGPW